MNGAGEVTERAKKRRLRIATAAGPPFAVPVQEDATVADACAAAEDSLPQLREELDAACSFGARLKRRMDGLLRGGGLVRRRRPVAVTAEALDVPQPQPPDDDVDDEPPAEA